VTRKSVTHSPAGGVGKVLTFDEWFAGALPNRTHGSNREVI
jgi:hypothetical protein